MVCSDHGREMAHTHAEGVLMVALTTLNLPAEAWKSARLLRAVPNCRLLLMLAYHMLSTALSVEETGLMAYLQTPPEAGPSVVQVTSGLQNWKCPGRRLVEMVEDFLQLHSYIATSVFRQDSHKAFGIEQEGELWVSAKVKHHTNDESEFNEIVKLFSFVEVTLIQYATVAGRFPGVAASPVKPKPKKANKLEVVPDEPAKGQTHRMQPRLPHLDQSLKGKLKATLRVAQLR